MMKLLIKNLIYYLLLHLIGFSDHIWDHMSTKPYMVIICGFQIICGHGFQIIYGPFSTIYGCLYDRWAKSHMIPYMILKQIICQHVFKSYAKSYMILKSYMIWIQIIYAWIQIIHGIISNHIWFKSYMATIYGIETNHMSNHMSSNHMWNHIHSIIYNPIIYGTTYDSWYGLLYLFIKSYLRTICCSNIWLSYMKSYVKSYSMWNHMNVVRTKMFILIMYTFTLILTLTLIDDCSYSQLHLSLFLLLFLLLIVLFLDVRPPKLISFSLLMILSHTRRRRPPLPP